jgi:hypothetical protein
MLNRPPGAHGPTIKINKNNYINIFEINLICTSLTAYYSTNPYYILFDHTELLTSGVPSNHQTPEPFMHSKSTWAWLLNALGTPQISHWILHNTLIPTIRQTPLVTPMRYVYTATLQYGTPFKHSRRSILFRFVFLFFNTSLIIKIYYLIYI